MPSELIFRINLGVIGVLIYAIRFYYIGLTGRTEDSALTSRTSKAKMLWIGAIGLVVMIIPITYVLMPYWLEWAALPLAAGWRWIGVGLGLMSTLLLFWIHSTREAITTCRVS